VSGKESKDAIAELEQGPGFCTRFHLSCTLDLERAASELSSLGYPALSRSIMEIAKFHEAEMQIYRSIEMRDSAPHDQQLSSRCRPLVCRCGASSWGGGTDHDPEPWCNSCGARQSEGRVDSQVGQKEQP